MTVATGFALEASIAAPFPVFAVTKSWPETLAFVVLMLPATVSFPVMLSLPPIVTVEPLWLMIELLTLALPPLLEKSGTKLVLQAVPDKQMISFACSAKDPCWLPLVPVLPEEGATMKAERGRPPR